ncbi:MAG: hypothetical protein V7724_08385 [Sediminicola sp.]|tara:strand:+ start:39140 stop:39493 length:354 start_codon:yes stop_codon:yes gene_type:complete
MLVNFPNSSKLLETATAENLYGELVSQLLKDFGLANILMDIPKETGPEALKKRLHEKVYMLIMEKFAEYLNLLYIIDVPEREVKAIKSLDVVEIAEQVTFLILKREWQKVWFRSQYS